MEACLQAPRLLKPVHPDPCSADVVACMIVTWQSVKRNFGWAYQVPRVYADIYALGL